MRSVPWSVIAAVGMMIAVPTSRAALADEYWPMVQINCVPEFRYFSLKTFGLHNIGPHSKRENVPEVFTSVAAEHQIYLLEQVAKHQVTCSLPTGQVKVSIPFYHPPQATGYCGGVEWASIKVEFDSEPVADIEDSHGGCLDGFYTHVVEITEYEARHCTRTQDISDAVITSLQCKAADIGRDP